MAELKKITSVVGVELVELSAIDWRILGFALDALGDKYAAGEWTPVVQAEYRSLTNLQRLVTEARNATWVDE